MKTKFKDLLLYSLATIGVVALFISATQPQESHGTPESHVWEMHASLEDDARMYAINKQTGEVRKYARNMTGNSSYNYFVMREK